MSKCSSLFQNVSCFVFCLLSAGFANSHSPLQCHSQSFYFPGCDSNPAARNYTSNCPRLSWAIRSYTDTPHAAPKRYYLMWLELEQGKYPEDHLFPPSPLWKIWWVMLAHAHGTWMGSRFFISSGLWPADLTTWNMGILDHMCLYQYFKSLGMEIPVSTLI